jgi:hypothetical protein
VAKLSLSLEAPTHYEGDSVPRDFIEDEEAPTPDDIANRLTDVNGVTYILHFVQDRLWDNNGNLLSDGVDTYTFDFKKDRPLGKLGTSLRSRQPVDFCVWFFDKFELCVKWAGRPLAEDGGQRDGKLHPGLE